ncbi:MAG: hypothetical protein H6822_15265 [Planctomycetaceae bacterium]|nr:hypothetical protein [Planctomycetales bacterium]MCB9923541.1 hypothetical protein [Planctomycetaceae bacterium]
MNQRTSPRLLPGPATAPITLRPSNGEDTLRGWILDESDEGVAIQLGRRCHFQPNDHVELLVGDAWESAIVTSTRRQGVASRIGLRWTGTCKVPSSPRL